MIRDQIFEEIKRIGDLSNNYLRSDRKTENEELERFFCRFEKIRIDIYDELRNENLFREFGVGEPIQNINYEYEAKVEDDILKIYIPERIPKINKGINYVQKQILYNVSNVVSKYKGLFYNKYVMVIVRIYDDAKIWDSDNRNVKPIQDGLINGKVIKDDNIYCTCYMVQGYYSDKPHAEVYVVEADNILKIINKKVR